ncbi:MAG: UbiX family flavin prenyltransferase [Methanospirillum sp.]|nr:UbiX family flavin prenyltransferase [Methanospirillum sp.]
MSRRKEFVVGVTGASGAPYAHRLLEVLAEEADVHLVVTRQARAIAAIEGVRYEGFSVTGHDNADLAASIASGSHHADGMAIVPCSTKTLASVAHGLSSSLIGRAADVTLKERRPLVLLVREMPLSRVHLRNMLAADEAGATVMVASPGFYGRPATIADLVDMVVGRVLDHLGMDLGVGPRWEGAP